MSRSELCIGFCCVGVELCFVVLLCVGMELCIRVL